ncbi:hypothetical protein [Mucilaginibacter kameinonensis]|uniref:hypothetical protein n=1 Tax=Mucilaginibacter kameinonensis TaxID=452286 RepID=UPI000EF80799|nr:hypothetical protein [Mucilaginibacter kameinonensis]
MGYFTTPVVLDIDTPEGNRKTITIVPDYVESEKRFTGAYEIWEEDRSHGYIAFDDAHEHWEHSDMDLSYSEIVQLASFIKDHEDADLDGVEF